MPCIPLPAPCCRYPTLSLIIVHTPLDSPTLGQVLRVTWHDCSEMFCFLNPGTASDVFCKSREQVKRRDNRSGSECVWTNSLFITKTKTKSQNNINTWQKRTRKGVRRTAEKKMSGCLIFPFRQLDIPPPFRLCRHPIHGHASIPTVYYILKLAPLRLTHCRPRGYLSISRWIYE